MSLVEGEGVRERGFTDFPSGLGTGTGSMVTAVGVACSSARRLRSLRESSPFSLL